MKTIRPDYISICQRLFKEAGLVDLLDYDQPVEVIGDSYFLQGKFVNYPVVRVKQNNVYQVIPLIALEGLK